MIRGTAIDLALEVLDLIREPGPRYTLREIADVCTAMDPDNPVNTRDISYLEHRALSKLRREFGGADRRATLAKILSKPEAA